MARTENLGLACGYVLRGAHFGLFDWVLAALSCFDFSSRSLGVVRVSAGCAELLHMDVNVLVDIGGCGVGWVLR